METNLSHFTDVHMKVQKLRVATGNRLAHLERQGKKDARAEYIHKMAQDLEDTVKGYIAEEFESHPTYPWTSMIKGCGKEAAAKVIGIIEGTTFKSTGRSSIEAFDTPSRLRRFDGLAPVDGKAEKVSRGQKGLHYNPELRMMLWRLLTSLMRAKGVWYREYLKNDDYYMRRFERDGIKVIPTPAGRFCGVCLEEKKVPKTTKNCPDCGEKLMAKGEPPGVKFRGHVVNMAKRRTIRLWSDCLWVVWREALGLTTRTPWALEYGGHTTYISPWERVDEKVECPSCGSVNFYYLHPKGFVCRGCGHEWKE